MRLTVETVLNGYKTGVFPMAESASSPDVFWVEPLYRGILPLDKLLISTSLKKALKRNDYEVRVDHDFNAVIDACATARKNDRETWINASIREVYGALFTQKICHTIEIYRENRLIGGLYGLALGNAFFGESMFHRETDASKIALFWLVQRLKAGGFRLLDTQFLTPHLETLGVIEVKQALYKLLLAECLKGKGDFYALQSTSAKDFL
jgi:leucyl/phenylalanyl-tRNA---protein transferase